MRAALLALLSAASLAAQSAPPQPAFEVASIKQNVTNDTRASWNTSEDGSVTLVNRPLRSIIAQAYGIGGSLQSSSALVPFKFVEGPAALLEMRFNISARAPAGAGRSQAPAMLQALLADRFRLRIRPDTRPTPVYAITVARRGRLGPGLRPSAADCVALFLSGQNIRNADEKSRAVCWADIDFDRVRAGVITDVYGGPIAQLATRLQGYLDRPLIDATGLSGVFEWRVTFTNNPLGNSAAPSIFTAFEEQLGLKLEARTAPFEVFVIDSIEMPTPD